MIATVLLAAGSARRFDGTQKLLALVPNQGGLMPLVRLTVLGMLKAGLDRIVVVVGREGEGVKRVVHDLGVTVVINPDYASGMSSSLRVAVHEAMHRWPESEALLIALGDQPLIGTGVLEAVVRRFEARAADDDLGVVVPRFRGELGNPVLFTRELVPELMTMTGDFGARAVVECDPPRVRYVDFDRPAPRDVDTTEDLAALAADLRRG